MARPKKNRTPQQTDGIARANIDAQALERVGRDSAARANELAVIDTQFALEGPFDYDAIDAATPAMLHMEVTAKLWLGRAFILVREHLPGKFGAYLEKHGVHPRMAQIHMAIARSFDTNDARRLLAARLPVGKLLELTAESGETIEKLANGELVEGFEDGLYSMSRKEIRAAIRKKERAIEDLKEEREVDKQIIREKDERINKLSRRSTRSSTREQVTELMADLDRFKVEAATNLKQMMDTAGAIDTIYAEAKEQPDEEVTRCIESALEFTSKWVHELADALGE